MHDLAGVTFVQSVASPALAMVVPLLVRGLRSRLTATRRQSCVIIDNMSKLVDEPLDAAPFLPSLLPALQFAADNMSDPEARGVAERAANALNKLGQACEVLKLTAKEIDHNLVLQAIKAKVPAAVATQFELALSYIADMCCSLMRLHKFDSSEWEGEIAKYLAVITDANSAKTTVEQLRAECREMVKVAPPKDEDDDGAEELCNCTFTLAYGTKILLHNTNMRLKRGHKYGLLGANDSGKTTLMRSIANGSVEGFPDPASVRTVFVEADILGELSHLSCVDYIMSDPRLSGLERDEVLRTMATVGFTEDGKAKPFHAVSTLSGGWRMKLALARAMLQRADILLLDEVNKLRHF
jgi:elongation factor 3